MEEKLFKRRKLPWEQGVGEAEEGTGEKWDNFNRITITLFF